MKTALTLAAVFALSAPALAESRSVLIVVSHGKDGKSTVTVHSDDKGDRREAAMVGEACKAVSEMRGWGSTVNVYVVTDRPLAGTDRKALFDAIDANAWLDLSYYGRQPPKNLANHFLKPAKRVRDPEGDDSPAAVERARKRGAATAAADIKAGRPVILYYGKPWPGGKLPERYRVALALCYLESKTQDQAAAQLGLAKSTLKVRLERGKELLRARLVRRGLGPVALLVAAT